jgi:Co/Zn/Cd efflux system component
MINLVMFFVEFYFGWISDSVALVGDSLDMLGDAVTYASSLVVVGMGVIAKARVARLKATIMLVFGGVISLRCVYRGIFPAVPEFDIMLSIGFLALIMNLVCLFLLTRHRDDDINMRSVWICSRNDIIANTSVLLAAGAVYLTNSPYPDLFVGGALAYLFTKSALTIFREAKQSIAESSSV